MSTTESPAAWEGLYSKLTDNEGAIDAFGHRPDDTQGGKNPVLNNKL